MSDSRKRGLERLTALRAETFAAGDAMAEEAARFHAMRDGPKTEAISAFNLFQTPEPLAFELVSILKAELGRPLDGLRVLEPSAGLGRLFRAIRASSCCEVVLVEIAPQCARHLYEITNGDGSARLVQADFLACDADRLGGLFDAVVMNPPFKQGLDLKHIEHARQMLKPGGVLVSLCYVGARQRAAFGDRWELLPPESFKCEGTRAEVARVIVRK